MSETLSNGFKLPETGDRNFWQDLAFDIERVNDHDHNGVNSEKLSPLNFDKSVVSVASAGWTAVSGESGTYKQTLTIPTGYDMVNMQVKFIIDGGGEDGFEVHPSVRKVSATTFDVFINDNTTSLKAVYG